MTLFVETRGVQGSESNMLQFRIHTCIVLLVYVHE